MLQKFSQFIKDNLLFSEDEAILVAVSGGMDSVALSSLLHKAGFTFGIAHCNFKLRGEESDGDEEFVRQLASDLRVKFHVKSFETAEYARNNGISLQMAARDMRYNWFEHLRATEGYNVIATAHHLDDQTETFFINILRGAGLTGIHGILPKNDNIVRPMLFANREKIDEYVRNNRLPYREDSSNKSRKYLRNRLRHELLPVLMDIDPAFSQKLDQTMHHLRGVEDILNQEIETINKRILIIKEDCFQIEISKINELHPSDTWIFLILQPFGFSSTLAREIAESLNGLSGKMFFSPTHRLVKDRELLIIEPLTSLKTEEKEFLIEQETPGISIPFPLEFRTLPVAEALAVLHNPAFACLDANKLTYPLSLRLWRNGDRFIPFGMKGWKKVSDFLTDIKLSVPEKEKTWLLFSADEVAWIVGKRIDDRFGITKQTQLAKVISLTNVHSNPGIKVERK